MKEEFKEISNLYNLLNLKDSNDNNDLKKRTALYEFNKTISECINNLEDIYYKIFLSELNDEDIKNLYPIEKEINDRKKFMNDLLMSYMICNQIIENNNIETID